MSVTFWMPQAPTERVQPYPDEPEYWEDRPVAPFIEFNLSNSNAAAMMRLLCPAATHDSEIEPCGEFSLEEMARLRQQCILVLNTTRKELEYVDPFIERKPGHATVHHGGRDEDYVTRRLN